MPRGLFTAWSMADLGDLVEHHPLHRHLGLELLEQVPADRLALAVLVRREVQLAGVLERRPQLLDDLLAPLGQLVGRLEAVVDVDGQPLRRAGRRRGPPRRARRRRRRGTWRSSSPSPGIRRRPGAWPFGSFRYGNRGRRVKASCRRRADCHARSTWVTGDDGRQDDDVPPWIELPWRAAAAAATSAMVVAACRLPRLRRRPGHCRPRGGARAGRRRSWWRCPVVHRRAVVVVQRGSDRDAAHGRRRRARRQPTSRRSRTTCDRPAWPRPSAGPRPCRWSATGC